MYVREATLCSLSQFTAVCLRLGCFIAVGMQSQKFLANYVTHKTLAPVFKFKASGEERNEKFILLRKTDA